MAQSILDLILRTKKTGTGEKDAQSGLKGLNSALGSTLGVTLGVTAAFGALAAGLKFVVGEAAQAQVVQAQLGAVLKSTGEAAGMSAEEVNSLADRLSELSGVEDETIIKAEAVLLTFTKVSEEVFPGATEAALNMSAALGQDLQGSIIMIGKALNDPIQGVTALRRVGVSFTQSQMDMIQSLVESNQTLEAQKLILGELETEFGGAAEAMGDTFTGSVNKLKVAFGNLGEAVGTDLLPGLTAAADGLTALLTFGDKLNAMLADNASAAIAAGTSWKEYVTTQVDALHAAGLLTAQKQRYIEELINTRYATDAEREALERLLVSLGILIHDTYMYALMAQKAYDAQQGINYGLDEGEKIAIRYGRATDEATAALEAEKVAAEEAAEAEEAYRAGMRELEALIGGKLGPEVEDYTASQEELSERMAEVNAEIERALGQGYSEAGSKVQGLRGEYSDLAEEYQANADEHREATNNIIFDIAQQQLALSGLSPELQLGALEEMAESLGIIDLASQSATVAIKAVVSATNEENAGNLGEALDYIAQAALDGVVNAEELKTALDILNGTVVVITYEYQTVGSPGGGGGQWQPPEEYQEGGDFWVNRPTVIMVGEGGKPEHVTVTPEGEQGPGGTGINITQNFYGGANPEQVGAAASNAVLEAARRIGVR